MRKLLIPFGVLLLFSSSQLMAQITISTNTFQPAPGTTIQNRNDLSLSATEFNAMTAGTGGPMTWDFSSHSFGGGQIFEVVSPASVPSTGTFPDGNLVFMTVIGADTVWSVNKSSATVYWLLGLITHNSAGESIVAYQDSTADYNFPLNYNDQWTSHHSWRQDFSTTYAEFYDTTSYHVDAWGTVKYNATSVPVIRIIEQSRVLTNVFLTDGTPVTSYSRLETSVNFVNAGFEMIASLNASEFGGDLIYSGTVVGSFIGGATDVREELTEHLPNTFSIEQNYPNPFNPSTAIRFSLPVNSSVKLRVLNVLGHEVRVLVDQQLNAGSYIADWDGTDQNGSPIASGVYFYRVDAGQFAETKKMVLLK